MICSERIARSLPEALISPHQAEIWRSLASAQLTRFQASSQEVRLASIRRRAKVSTAGLPALLWERKTS